MSDYEEPKISLITESDLLNSVALLSSSGGSGGGSGSSSSLPTLAETIYKNFAIGKSGSGSLNQSGAKDVCVLIEAYWTKVNSYYSSQSNKYRAWVFFRSIGAISYASNSGKWGSFFAWESVAGVFTSFSQFYTGTLGLDDASRYVIEKSVKEGHGRSEGIDFSHFCITAATHLAIDLGLSSAASLTNIVDLSSCGLAKEKTLKALSGWLGDAALSSGGGVSMPLEDVKADIDAAYLTESLLSNASYGASFRLRQYYSSYVSNRYGLFRTCLGLTKTNILDAIIKTMVYQGIESSSLLKQSGSAKELVLRSKYSDVYENFYSKI